MKSIKDNTAMVPFLLFGILGVIVIYSWLKGRPKPLTQAQKDAIYNQQDDKA